MDEQREQAYVSLIQELLDCASGEEVAILSNHPELVDEGLVQVMQAVAEMMEEQGQGNAGWLRNFAGKIAGVNYELPQLQTKLAAYALLQQGFQQYQQSQYPQAWQSLQQSLALYQEIGDKAGIANCWGQLGSIQRNRGNWDEAERLYRQCLEIETELGDRSGMASSWGVLGDIERNRGNWDEAERLYQKKLDTCRELGDKSEMSQVIGTLGSIQKLRGNWDEAERLYRQYLEMMTELGDRSGMATSYNLLAFVHKHSNKIPEAIAAWRAGLAICPPDRFPLEALELGRRLGDTGFDIQDWETAIEGYEAAIEAVETRCGFTDSYREKQKRREAAVEIYEKLVQACINSGDIGRALVSVERSKSRNLIELLTNRELYPKGDVPPELLAQLDSLRREVTAKQRLIESLDNPTASDERGTGGMGQRGSGSSSFTPDASHCDPASRLRKGTTSLNATSGYPDNLRGHFHPHSTGENHPIFPDSGITG